MATKNEIIESILENKNNTLTKEELVKETYKDLLATLSNLESSEYKDESKDDEENSASKIEEELRAKIEKELRDKIKAELEAEAEDKNGKKELDRHRLVPVMNMTYGKLIYISRKTGAKWVWESYGDVDEIELFELQSMKTSYKGFLNDPLLLVLDEEIVDYLGLSKKYEDILKFEDLEVLFKMNNKEFADLLELAPKSLVVTIVSKAREMYENGTLESIWKVNYLNDKYGTDIGQRG